VAKPRHGLGRGLDALIPGASAMVSPRQSALSEAGLIELPVHLIIPNPRQPRHPLDDQDEQLRELAESIREHGIIQPIVVTELATQESPLNVWEHTSPGAVTDDVPRYQIVAGERRWRAARLAGRTTIPAVIKEVTPQQMLELALIENIQRSDLNPIEEAFAYQALIEEYGLTQEEVARRVGKSRVTITNALRLLQLPSAIREKLAARLEDFTPGHARAILRIPRREDQIHAMNQIIAQRLSVRAAEELAERLAQGSPHLAQGKRGRRQTSPELRVLEEEFRAALAVKVALRRSQRGKGSLTLYFNNEDELQRLYDRIVGQDR
jgi:ParB family chromosome partitioning protein